MPDTKADNLAFTCFRTFTIALRLVCKDYILGGYQDPHYQATGSYLLAAAPVLGQIAHYVVEPSATSLDLFGAVLAGGILQSVYRQELPTADTVKLPRLLLDVAIFTAQMNRT